MVFAPATVHISPVGDEFAPVSAARHSGFSAISEVVTPRAFGCACAAMSYPVAFISDFGHFARGAPAPCILNRCARTTMATLTFDIETSALPHDAFDEAQWEFLFREADKLPDPAAREQKRAEIVQQLNLWPLTAQVVCIAMVNVDTDRGQVLYLSGDNQSKADQDNTVEFVPCPDEATLLSSFWDVARHYEHVVTFNGRGFDVPFLYLRSAVRGVAITRKDWIGYRYSTEPHCDLADQLTFYNVSGREGAARKFNLDFYCKVFGIDSPKSHGVTGRDVNQLMAEGRYIEVAEYCLRDVRATVALYKIWKERLAGIK